MKPFSSLSRSMLLAALCGILPLTAQAQGAVSDAEVKSAIAVASKALGGFNSVLGIPEEADRGAANATCVAKGACSIAAAAQSLQTTATVLATELEQRRADSNMLAGNFYQPGIAALQPALQALPQLIRAGHGTQAKQLPAASQSAVAALQSAVSYLKLSGAPTEALESAMATGLGKAH